MISLSFKGCRFDINSSIHHFGHSFCVQPVTRTPAPMGKYRRGWDWLPIPSLTVSLSPSNLARKNKGVKFAIQNRRPNSLPHSIPSSQKFRKMDKQQQNQLSNYPKFPSTIFDGNDDSQRNYHCGFITHVQVRSNCNNSNYNVFILFVRVQPSWLELLVLWPVQGFWLHCWKQMPIRTNVFWQEWFGKEGIESKPKLSSTDSLFLCPFGVGLECSYSLLLLAFPFAQCSKFDEIHFV